MGTTPIIESDNAFVRDLLTTLKREKFSAGAWARFLKRAWDMSWDTVRKQPALLASWRLVTCIIGILGLCLFLLSLVFEGSLTALRLLPGFLFCVVWQQSDLFWHLGLNRSRATGQLYSRIGLANVLTWTRGLAASFLLGRLVGGVATSAGLALGIFLAGVVTDILDGQVARHTHTQSKLGQIADGEADFCLYLALTCILIQNSVLPLWLGILMLARFVAPLLAALISYFLLVQTVRFGSTVWGKYAGLAQSLYFLVVLAPVQFESITRLVNLPLLIVTLLLLFIAPIAQIIKNVRAQ